MSSGAFTVSLAGYQTARESIGDGPYRCVVTLQPTSAPTESNVQCRNMEQRMPNNKMQRTSHG